MLLVVLGHIGVNDNFSSTYLFKWIYAFHMPLFFWISGFLFNGEISFREFLIKKFERLLIPLVVLTSFVYFPKVLLSKFAIRPAEGSFIGFFASFAYPDMNPIQVLWFLSVLFEVYVIAWIAYHLFKSNRIAWVVLGCCSIAGNYVLPEIRLLGISKVIYYLPYFVVGFLCRRCYHLLINQLQKYISAILVISTIVYLLGVAFEINKYILAIVGITSIISFVVYFTNRNITFSKSLRHYSFSIYLLQWFPMVAVRVLLYDMLNWNITICYILMFTTGIIVPITVCKICERLITEKGVGRLIRLSIGLS